MLLLHLKLGGRRQEVNRESRPVGAVADSGYRGDDGAAGGGRQRTVGEQHVETVHQPGRVSGKRRERGDVEPAPRRTRDRRVGGYAVAVDELIDEIGGRE